MKIRNCLIVTLGLNWWPIRGSNLTKKYIGKIFKKHIFEKFNATIFEIIIQAFANNVNSKL